MNRPGNPTELKLMDIAFKKLRESNLKAELKKKAVGLGQHVRDVHEKEKP